MLNRVVASSSSSAVYSGAESQTRLALLTSSEEQRGLTIVRTTRASVKRLPVSQVHHPLHLTSLSENILPEWPESIFASLGSKGGKVAISPNSGLLL